MATLSTVIDSNTLEPETTKIKDGMPFKNLLLNAFVKSSSGPVNDWYTMEVGIRTTATVEVNATTGQVKVRFGAEEAETS
jgi:hypothetical protein